MSVAWGDLPLLALRCILDHLTVKDALAATSTCRHWRSVMHLYEGKKFLLKLYVKDIKKNIFLARIFKKHVKRLHIYIDTTDEEELESFMNYILPLFFDTIKLTELVFLGPSYLLKDTKVPTPQLKRIIVETLLFKHLLTVEKLILMGCEMATPKNENDRHTHKYVEYYSRPLTFSTKRSLDDSVLTRANVGLMQFSKLQNIIIDYEYVSSGTVNTLSRLPKLVLLTLNIGHRRPVAMSKFDWPPKRLRVALNIIAVPLSRFKDIMQNIFVIGLMVVSVKVMFCKTFHVPFIGLISRQYSSTLKELVWVDAPADSTISRTVKPETYDVCVNNILLMCWQCAHLRRLVIHGYWLWQYDVQGIVRLRRSLERLEVSAVYGRQNQFGTDDNSVLRVMSTDKVAPLEDEYVEKINEYTQFLWEPCDYETLHPSLKVGATPQDCADYIMEEATNRLTIMYV